MFIIHENLFFFFSFVEEETHLWVDCNCVMKDVTSFQLHTQKQTHSK